MTVVAKLGSSIVADADGDVRGEVLDRDLRAGGGAARRRRGRRDGDVWGDRARDAADGLRRAPRGGGRAAVRRRRWGRGRCFRACWRAAPGGSKRARGAGAAELLRRLDPGELPERARYLAPAARLAGGAGDPGENDTTATDEITFGDNDFLAAQVALLLDARALVLLTDTAGLPSADPRRDPEAADRARGGLRAACEIRDRRPGVALRLGWDAQQGGSGRDGHVRRNRRRGLRWAQGGTLLAAAGGRAWARRSPPIPDGCRASRSGCATRSRARHRDGRRGGGQGAREQGSSLLPVGITSVDGDFEAGDAVDVVCDSEPVGKGIVNCSAGELARIRRMKSAEVVELMPHASGRPFTGTSSCSHDRDARASFAQGATTAESLGRGALRGCRTPCPIRPPCEHTASSSQRPLWVNRAWSRRPFLLGDLDQLALGGVVPDPGEREAVRRIRSRCRPHRRRTRCPRVGCASPPARRRRCAGRLRPRSSPSRARHATSA